MATKTTKRAREAISKPAASTNSFIDALKFVKVAQSSTGVHYQTHCLIHNHWLVAYDGVLTVGTKIEEDISACPNSEKLLAALSKCGQKYSITQLDSGKISLKSEKFKALVNCIEHSQIPALGPDDNIIPIDNKIKKAFELTNQIINDSAVEAFTAGILFKSGSIVSTNKHVLVEFWHGFNIPVELLITLRHFILMTKVLLKPSCLQTVTQITKKY
jgi:hypothetical protein